MARSLMIGCGRFSPSFKPGPMVRLLKFRAVGSRYGSHLLPTRSKLFNMADYRNERNQGNNEMSEQRRRGFAAMDPQQRREIASKGGSASPGNFANDRNRAAEAGRKGGRARGARNGSDQSSNGPSSELRNEDPRI